MLSEFLGVACHVEQFVGRWLDVSPEDRSCLTSRSRADQGGLGRGFLLGGRVWDIGSKIRIHFGPVGNEEIAMLTPGTKSHARLGDLVRSYLGPGTDCELVLEPTSDVGGGLRLAASGARLGLTSWMVGASGRRAPATLPLSRPMHA
jgi:type VI secretion system protein ImpH